MLGKVMPLFVQIGELKMFSMLASSFDHRNKELFCHNIIKLPFAFVPDISRKYRRLQRLFPRRPRQDGLGADGRFKEDLRHPVNPP